MENYKFYPISCLKYGHGNGGFQNCQTVLIKSLGTVQSNDWQGGPGGWEGVILGQNGK